MKSLIFKYYHFVREYLCEKSSNLLNTIHSFFFFGDPNDSHLSKGLTLRQTKRVSKLQARSHRTGSQLKLSWPLFYMVINIRLYLNHKLLVSFSQSSLQPQVFNFSTGFNLLHGVPWQSTTFCAKGFNRLYQQEPCLSLSSPQEIRIRTVYLLVLVLQKTVNMISALLTLANYEKRSIPQGE